MDIVSMDSPARIALEASIKHWEQVALSTHPGQVLIGIKECTLCIVFYRGGCVGCPVMFRTGQPNCDDTPYGAARNAHLIWRQADIIYAGTALMEEKQRRFKEAAQSEIDFLKSLREIV